MFHQEAGDLIQNTLTQRALLRTHQQDIARAQTLVPGLRLQIDRLFAPTISRQPDTLRLEVERRYTLNYHLPISAEHQARGAGSEPVAVVLEKFTDRNILEIAIPERQLGLRLTEFKAYNQAPFTDQYGRPLRQFHEDDRLATTAVMQSYLGLCRQIKETGVLMSFSCIPER